MDIEDIFRKYKLKLIRVESSYTILRAFPGWIIAIFNNNKITVAIVHLFL